jgi:hypothetical protein
MTLRRRKLLIVLAAIGLAGVVIHACTIPPFSPSTVSGWPACQIVSVNIDPRFSPDEFTAIQTAFLSWQNSVNFGKGTIIQFVGFTQSGSAVAAPGFHQGTNVYQVSKTVPISNSGDNAFSGPVTTGTARLWSWTQINPSISNTLFLTQIMAHEIGHSFALLDCDFCANQSSIMITSAPTNDTSVLPNGPNGCDQAGCPILL